MQRFWTAVSTSNQEIEIPDLPAPSTPATKLRRIQRIALTLFVIEIVIFIIAEFVFADLTLYSYFSTYEDDWGWGVFFMFMPYYLIGLFIMGILGVMLIDRIMMTIFVIILIMNLIFYALPAVLIALLTGSVLVTQIFHNTFLETLGVFFCFAGVSLPYLLAVAIVIYVIAFMISLSSLKAQFEANPRFQYENTN